MASASAALCKLSLAMPLIAPASASAALRKLSVSVFSTAAFRRFLLAAPIAGYCHCRRALPADLLPSPATTLVSLLTP